MTARWIEDAISAAMIDGLLHPDKLAQELATRLPVEEMREAGRHAVAELRSQLAGAILVPESHSVPSVHISPRMYADVAVSAAIAVLKR